MNTKLDFDRVHLSPELVKSKKMGPIKKAQARKSVLVHADLSQKAKLRLAAKKGRAGA